MKKESKRQPPPKKIIRKEVRANMRIKIEQAEKSANLGRHRRNDNSNILSEELDDNELGRWKHHAEKEMSRLWNGQSSHWTK